MADVPLVSVVIPTYNSPDYLIQTLETVLAQTFTDYEIVIINDGSTDNTAARLEPYKDRIRLITQTNGGIGVARNRGIDEARGKYVALLDHDDLWMPEKLQFQVAFYQRHPECSMVVVPHSNTDSPNEKCYNLKLATRNGGLIFRPLKEARRSHNRLIMQTSGIMFEKARADGLRFETRRGCMEDVPFFLGLFGRGPVGVAGNKPLMLYRRHTGSYSQRADFWFEGMKRLRELDAQGRFHEITGVNRTDLDKRLAVMAQKFAVIVKNIGCFKEAMEMYHAEKPFQLQQRQFGFLIAFPVRVWLTKWKTGGKRLRPADASKPD